MILWHAVLTVIINGKAKKFYHSGFQKTGKTVPIADIDNTFLLEHKSYLH